MENILLLITTLLISVVIIWAFVFKHKEYKNYHYKCPKCSNIFKPATFMKSAWALYSIDTKKLKCPRSGAKNWVKMIANGE